MNTELLNVTRMTAGLLFPGRPFPQNEVNQLYASVTSRFPFQSLQHLPDGARFANQDNDLIIQSPPMQPGVPPQPGRMQVNYANMMHFELAKEQTLQMFENVSDQFAIQAFLTFGIKLTAFLPLPEGTSSATLIENSIFAGYQDQLNSLRGMRQGCGLRVVTNIDNGAFDLKIEPFFGDIGHLFIELDAQYPEQFNGIDPVEEKMDMAYNFLNEDVRNLIGTM